MRSVRPILTNLTLCGFFILSTSPAWADSASEALDNLMRPQSYQSKRVSSAKQDLTQNRDNRPIEIGQTLALGELEGPGVITHIWITVASEDPFYARSLVLRIYWDGMDKPSVEAPLGDFFAVGNGASAEVNSAPVSVTAFGRSRSCYWRMPFRKSARITVTNESATQRTGSFYYYLDWRKTDPLPDDTPYFHAQYRQQHPAKPGDYIVLDTTGQGHYVGMVYSALQTQIGWFGEGDDRFYIDGESYPSLSGTGTEDYFNDAWGFHEFSRPSFGVPMFEGYFPGDRVTAYRWHLSDPVTFQKSLKVAMEHYGSLFTESVDYLGQFFERPDWLSSVAFWYQTPIMTFGEPLPAASQRVAPYRVLSPKELTIRAIPETGLMKDLGAYLPTQAGASVEFAFEIKEPGRYQVNAIMSHSFVGGMFQASIDGTPVGPPRDFYLEGEDSLWERFDLHVFQPGTHVLRFDGSAISARKRTMLPEIGGLQLEHLILLRLEDLAGYMEPTQREIEKKQSQPQDEHK